MNRDKVGALSGGNLRGEDAIVMQYITGDNKSAILLEIYKFSGKRYGWGKMRRLLAESI